MLLTSSGCRAGMLLNTYNAQRPPPAKQNYLVQDVKGAKAEKL